MNITLSPVAEYLGVCIIERGGNVEKMFQGKKYTTDGFIYIARHLSEEGKIPLTKFADEREAKTFLDAITPEHRAEYVGMMEFWAKYMKNPVSAVARYCWDDANGCFVTQDTAVDGAQRVVNLKGVLK